MKQFLLGILMLGMAACSSIPGLEKDASHRDRLLGLEVQFNGVFALMKEYENLPRCHVVSTKVCSDQTAVNRMRAVVRSFDSTSDTAWRVLKEVETTDDAKDAAIAAVGVVVADAKRLYDGVKGVIVGKKES